MAAYTAIDDSEAYFQAEKYTGDGSANHAITLSGSTDMQPDIVWIKNTDATDSHCFFDSARGATKVMHVDTTAAEATDSDTLDSFTSDGFQVDADVKVNTSSEDYMSYNWKGGTTSGITTTGTDTTPSAYSFNQTSGVSVVVYSGNATDDTQVAHGLGAVPDVVIVKRTNGVTSWDMFHQATLNTHKMELDSTATKADDDSRWSDADPDANNFTLGNASYVNGTGGTYMAMIFAPKQGFSKFGSYVGNGNADGTFIYTGFRPAFMLIKQIGVSSWLLFDNKSPGYNSASVHLQPDNTNAYSTWSTSDILSNGFKVLNTDSAMNGSGTTYIYMAFADAPFVNSNGVPCNAR